MDADAKRPLDPQAGDDASAEIAVESDQPRTLTVAETASILGCSKNHLYALIAEDRFPGVIRLGSKIVISRQAVEEMLG